MRSANSFRLISSLVFLASVEAHRTKIDALITALTPQEKISLVHGANYAGSENYAGYVPGIQRLGIPALQLADGEAGINGVQDATAIPSQINVAATWSRSMAKAAGHVTGLEARLLKAGVALAPRVNLLRDPFTGSSWQSYSEDAYLNAQLGAQGVQGIQAEGIMANTKQIGPSSSGASSGDTNSQVDLQVLHEIYWQPHEVLVYAGVATMMCSYSQVNGIPACQYEELLNRTVRGDFNFTGIVMSDWGATHSTAPSIKASLDWEMGSRTYYTTPLYNDIYVHGNLSEGYLDRALYHILSTYDRFGLIGQNLTALDLIPNPLPAKVVEHSAAVAYDIACRSGILLKNKGDLLPLSKSLSKFAVIGPAAFQYNHGAGFAERAYGIPSRLKSALNAIQELTGNDHIQTAIGVDVHGTLIPASSLQQEDGTPGMLRTNSEGETSLDPDINFSGSSALPGNSSYSWAGFLKANEDGYYRLSLQRRFSRAGGRLNDSDYLSVWAVEVLTVNGTVFDGFRLLGDGGARPWSSPLASKDGWDEVGTDVYLSAGLHNITVSVTNVFDDPVEVRLNWVTPSQREQNFQAAEKIASDVEVPIVFAHTNSPSDVGMELIHGFNELISRVATVNPRTVVVLNNADPVLMPWLEQVSSVLWMGYPGQEGGRATASLLFGDCNPQGKLTITYPQSVNDTVTRNPKYPERMATESGTAIFSEGINSAYRWYLSTQTNVLFPFGYGLSYTTFKYKNLAIEKAPSGGFKISIEIKNTGSRNGVDIPQLYLGPPENSSSKYPGVQFAVSTLVGFEDVEVLAGATKTVSFFITERQLSFWRPTDRSWVLGRGTRSIWVGTNAVRKDLVGKLDV
ncbi:Fn3-like domain-containing protein [Penicillium macrosclerotiorum]|uniref:Fn3-like domain-containing protein n=1 Tax=Penicillium macrosclerotiorum TaxID=303699 RepID=UPI0025489582|nr:Fn3-like domain-containing protein [Penicillium macrosclerotiorum]KAJ5679423.1 Fn3-like domain-containing protein [Penicillium macrosclerotiorum]